MSSKDMTPPIEVQDESFLRTIRVEAFCKLTEFSKAANADVDVKDGEHVYRYGDVVIIKGRMFLRLSNATATVFLVNGYRMIVMNQSIEHIRCLDKLPGDPS